MTAHAEVANPQRIAIAALERRLAMHRGTIWRWYRAGKFPAPHYLGTRRLWWVHDVEAWEAERMARTTPAAPPEAGSLG